MRVKVKEMLRQVALRCQAEGPARRAQDAATILSMLEGLDEDGARVYLEQFVKKWRLLPEPAPSERPSRGPTIRRRPMTQLERRVYLEFLAGPTPPRPLEVTVEGPPDEAPAHQDASPEGAEASTTRRPGAG